MKFSIIIPAHPLDRYNMILKAVESIKCQNYPDKEIIIAVGGNDELFVRLKVTMPKDVVILHDPNGRGPSRTRNLGLTGAHGDIIAFLEDDAVADINWLNNLDENYKDKTVMAVGGMATPLWHNKAPLWFPDELLWVVGCTYAGHPTNKTEIRSLPGCNMSFRREVFERMGPFNTNFGRPGNLIGAEDTEAFVRLKTKFPSGKIIWDPAVIVYHNVPKSRQNIKYVIRRSYGEGKGRAIIQGMYPKSLTTEFGLVRYIVRNSIPTRLLKILRGKASLSTFNQILILILSVIVTGISYLSTILLHSLVKLKNR